MDCRVKPGNDELNLARPVFCRTVPTWIGIVEGRVGCWPLSWLGLLPLPKGEGWGEGLRFIDRLRTPSPQPSPRWGEGAHRVCGDGQVAAHPTGRTSHAARARALRRCVVERRRAR